MSETGFEVGSTYENEKGTYEVLSIDERKDTMVIKWESGEEVSTAIGFQRRIIKRMRHEAEIAKFGRAVSESGVRIAALEPSSALVAGVALRLQKPWQGFQPAYGRDRPGNLLERPFITHKVVHRDTVFVSVPSRHQGHQ